MIINSNMPSAADLQNSRAAATNPAWTSDSSSAAGAATQPDADASRLQGLSEQAGDILDGAGADQAEGFLRGNMFSQPGMVYIAQAGLNPQTVYNLLQ